MDLSQLSFEEALKRLEAIVHRLESGDVPLEEAISLYAQGEELRGRCQERLEAAQARIDKIALGPDGTPTGTSPFEGG